MASLTDKGTQLKEKGFFFNFPRAYTEGAGRILNSKQNTMEDAASGQHNYKAKKKKTEKGNEKRWWYVELFFFSFLSCVCLPFAIAKQQQLLRSCEIVSLRLTGLHFSVFMTG